MNKIDFQGHEILNWLDYIQLKFHDLNYFEIDNQTEKDFIVINSRTNQTKIWVYGLSGECLQLNDCQYTSEKCKGWSGETCASDSDKYGIFNQENLNIIDEILETPIYNGWISTEYYLFNSIYQAITYFDQDKTKPHFVDYTNKFGCISIILFPLLILLNILLRYELIGRKEEIIVKPIINKKHL